MQPEEYVITYIVVARIANFLAKSKNYLAKLKFFYLLKICYVVSNIFSWFQSKVKLCPSALSLIFQWKQEHGQSMLCINCTRIKICNKLNEAQKIVLLKNSKKTSIKIDCIYSIILFTANKNLRLLKFCLTFFLFLQN